MLLFFASNPFHIFCLPSVPFTMYYCCCENWPGGCRWVRRLTAPMSLRIQASGTLLAAIMGLPCGHAEEEVLEREWYSALGSGCDTRLYQVGSFLCAYVE